MPGIEPVSGFADLSRQEAASPKTLYAVDALCHADSPVHDLSQLTRAAIAAVHAGSGHVLETSHAVFPNGAITLILILAESHLSIHTWPEDDLVAIDLFSCGAINAAMVIDGLAAALRLDVVRVRQVDRGAGPADR